MTQGSRAVVLDSGMVYALYDASDDWHARARAVCATAAAARVVPAPVIPEVDHLLRVRLGKAAREAFQRGLAEGHFLPVDLPRDGYARVLELNGSFSDLDLGFVDAAVVAIAEAIGVRRIATTDLRDFGPLAAALDLELVG